MDKFLSICFKFGKIFTVILLVTFLLSMISAGIYSLTTFKKSRFEYTYIFRNVCKY